MYEISARYKAMTVRFKCSDGKVRDFLLDTGAAASLVPYPMFRQMCRAANLNPSRLSLRAANGGSMPTRGSSVVHLRLPDQDMSEAPTVSHRFEVTEPGGMPDSLIISGVDFWDKLQPKIIWEGRKVECKKGDGTTFTVPFHIGSSRHADVLSVQATQRVNEQPGMRPLYSQQEIMLQPRQASTVEAHVREVMLSDKLWAVQAEELEFPANDETARPKVKVVLEGIVEPKGDTVKLLVKNPLQRQALVVPKGTVIAYVSGHTDMCDLLETAPLLNGSQINDHTAANMVSQATEQEELGMLEAQSSGVKDMRDQSWSDWFKYKLPKSRVLALFCIAAWILWSVAAVCGANRMVGVNSIMATEDLSNSVTKVRQRIASLPEGHPLKLDEAALQAKTAEFCKNQSGLKMYDSWKKTIGSAFTIEHVDSEEKGKYLQFLFQFREIFDTNPKAPKEIKGVECALYFRDAHVQPRARPVPRLTPQEWKHMEGETDTMLKNGIIRFSESDWACVPVFAKKKDGGLRYAIDLRPVNDCIFADKFPMGNMEEILGKLGKHSLFSTYDVSAGFWGLRVREQDRKYLAFHAVWQGHWNLFEFNRMPFGIKNGTSDFCRMYMKILGPTDDEPEGLIGRRCYIWVDDCVIFSSGEDEKLHTEHRNAIAAVLRRLVANGMCVKPSKCIWATIHLPFLGQIVHAGEGISPDPKKVEAMLNATTPDCVTQLRTFIGQTGWLAKHVEGFSMLIAPLRAIVNRYPSKVTADISQEWIKHPEARAAYTAVKIALCQTPVLRFPDFNKCFILLVDAAGGNNGGYGACLCQIDEEGRERPICYASTSLSKQQKGYGSTEAECAAMMWALRKWRHYLQGNTCIAVTDHAALTSLTKANKQFSNRKLANWAVEMSDYDLIIAKRAGRIHYTPDFLSRQLPSKEEEELMDAFKESSGRTHLLAHNLTVMQQFKLYSPKSTAARLHHEVTAATLIDETVDDGTEVTSIAALVAAIEAGDRKLREMQEGEEEYSPLDEFYDMVASNEAHEAVTVDRVKESQRSDKFCNAMINYLEEGKLPTTDNVRETCDEDSDYDSEEEGSGGVEEVELTAKQKAQQRQSARRAIQDMIKLAPHFAVSSQGVLLQLQARRSKHEKLARELECLQRVYIPFSDKQLQNDLMDSVHLETGHSSPRRTYQMLLQKVYWRHMYKSVHSRLQTCAKCQFYAYRAAKAPLLGHTQADRIGEKLALDIIQLPESNGYGYALTAEDVFSRYGFLVPLKDIKASTVLAALRERILVNGMGKPDTYLVDGGSEFKKEVTDAVEAWLAEKHVHGPHRHEAAGCIEAFNKTIEKRIALMCPEGKLEDWIHIWPDALEAYNSSVQGACSGGLLAAYSPAEIYFGRKLQFSIDRMADEAAAELLEREPATFHETMKRRALQVRKFVTQAREDYLEKAEKYDKQAKAKIRTFNAGDLVTVYSPSVSKKKNKLSALQEGPFEVTETDSRGLMFLIKKIGKSKSKGRWVHLDQIKQFKKFMMEDEGEEVAAAKPHSRQYGIEAIVGERGRTRRTKQYRILWESHDDTTWEPMANLDHADLKIKEWLKRTPEQQQRLMSATDAELVAEMKGGDSEAAAVVAIKRQFVGATSSTAQRQTAAGRSRREQQPTKVDEEFGWQTLLCAECAPAPDIQALISTVDNSWVQCSHGTVRVEGMSSHPEGFEMTRCHQPSCVEEAEGWWRKNREGLLINSNHPAAAPTQTRESSTAAVSVVEEEVQVAAAWTSKRVQKEKEKALLKRVQLDVSPKPGTFTLLMKTICKLAEISMEECASFVCSPPCETFTLADASNLSRNNHTRDHSDPTKPPRSAESCKTQLDWSRRRKAINHDNLVRRIVHSFLSDRKEGWDYELFIENPVGSLRQRPYMRGESFEELTDRKTVNYCAYGFDYSKATDIWTSLKTWEPAGRTGNGRCNLGACGRGTRGRNGRFRHRQVIAGSADRAVKGPNKKKQLWRLPGDLTAEWLAALGPPQPGKDVIVDVFAGGESWRAAVEAAGYRYVAVDITALIPN